MRRVIQELQDVLIGGALFVGEIMLFKAYWILTRQKYQPQKRIEISRQIGYKDDEDCKS